MTELKLALRGRLQESINAEIAGAEQAATFGMQLAAEGLKQEMRRQTRAGFDSRKLPNTWRSEVWPRRGHSAAAAAAVFSKAPKIMEAFEEGETIRSRDGFFMAVPTPAAPKQGIGGGRVSPENWPDHRFGPLRFVFRRQGPSLLVADVRARRGKRGGFTKASKTALRTGRGLATVPMFWLVPQVTLKKRIDFAGAARTWGAKLDDLIVGSWPDLPPRETR